MIPPDPARPPATSQPFAPGAYSASPPSPPPPFYAPPPSQPLYGAPPAAVPVYGTMPPPSQPMYGAAPPLPSQPLYPPMPPAPPMYGPSPAPSQPMYPYPPAQNLYAAPATVPFYAPPRGPSLQTTLFGLSAMPATARPYSRIQRTLLRSISPATVVNMWMTAAIGALVALVGGLILTAIAGAFWSSAIKDGLGSALTSSSSGGVSFSSVTQLMGQILTPDLWKLFALAHHVPLDVSASASTSLASTSASLSLGIPLTGLFLAPALALTLGGYVAAASDFSRRARYSMARGALLGPFYAVLLAITALIGSSSVSGNDILGTSGIATASGAVTVAPSAGFALLYGLIWGVIFGALGGWIHVSGRFWLSTALATLQTTRNSRLAGALAGAVASLVIGILLLSIAYVGVLVFSSISFAAQSSSISSLNLASTLTFDFLFAPVVAVYGFALGAGAPIGYFVTGGGGVGDFGVSVSLLNGYQTSGLPTGPEGTVTTPHFPPSSVYYLLVLAVLISYLAGGRIAARVARARVASDAFVAGALMAVPLSLLMTGAAVLASLTLSVSVNNGQSLSGGAGTFSIAPSLGGMLVAVLIGGAMCGGLGGASVFAMPALGRLPRALLVPLWPFGKLLHPLLDGLTRHNRQQRPSEAMRWIYDGVVAAVVFALLAIALDIVNSAAPTALPFGVVWRAEGIVAAVLVGLPLTCFLGALGAAFTAPPPLAPATTPPAPPFTPVYATVPASVPGALHPAAFPAPYPPAPSQPISPPIPGSGAFGTDAPTQSPL